MARGTSHSTNKTFFKVSFGTLRQGTLPSGDKVNESTPNAVRRETQDGTPSWALEIPWLSGKIESIFHKTSEKYKDTYEVVIDEGIDQSQLSFGDDSRFWIDFMKKLPNIDLTQEVKLTPYEFTDKEKGKRRVGVSVEQNGVKIASYYNKLKSDGTYEDLYGFPTAKKEYFENKDKTKRYFVDVKIFLDDEFKRLFADKFKKVENTPAVTEDGFNVPDESEPPF
jgi:hypothetical protein